MNVSSFFNYSEPLNDSDAVSTKTDFDFTLLSNWPSDHWSTFLDLTQTMRFDSGDPVFEQGDQESAIYVVAAGQFEIVYQPNQSTGAAGERRIATIELGCVLGEQAFLDQQPQLYTARAVTEGELVRFAAHGWEAFKARHPELASQLMGDLARIVSLRQRQTTMILGE